MCTSKIAFHLHCNGFLATTFHTSDIKYTSMYPFQIHNYGLHQTTYHGPHIKYTSVNTSVSFIITTCTMPSITGHIQNIRLYTYFRIIITAFIKGYKHTLLFHCNNGLHERTSTLCYTYNACVVICYCLCLHYIVRKFLPGPCHGPGSYSLVVHSGDPASIHGQTMWDLLRTNCTRTTLSLWTSLFSCKYHSTKAF